MRGNIRFIFFLLLLYILPVSACCQPEPETWQADTPDAYSFIHLSGNEIRQPTGMDSFYSRLSKLKMTHKGVIRIVHIGDSHIQADMMTSVLRQGFQSWFGNAGRGLVFPYQLARSNAPEDISASSNISWQYNRLAHPEISIATGITGFGIHSANRNAAVTLGLKEKEGMQEYFDRAVFFLGPDSACYRFNSPGLEQPISRSTRSQADTPSLVFNADTLLTGFTLTSCAENAPAVFDFYGVSLEKRKTPGVIYHTLGVNGAEYDQYTNNDLFWQQLGALRADLFIVSMGTNEAQDLQFDGAAFKMKCDSFMQRLHAASPKAAVVLTTPAGSYLKKKAPNKIVLKVSAALISYCKENHIPYWDLFGISGGYAATQAWRRNGLFSNDLVHYSGKGYRLQGQLLLSSLAGGYNNYLQKNRSRKKIKTEDK